MTVNAGRRLEYSAPFGNNIAHGRGLPLLLNPAVELIARLHVNTQKHLGMLRPAVLRALAQVNARLVRIDPHTVWVVGNQVSLTRQAWDPETVVSIGREQFDKGWRRMVRI